MNFTRRVLLLALFCVAAVLAQTTIDHNHQTIPDQKIETNQQCSGLYTISPISQNAYITVSSNYDDHRVRVQASFSSTFSDALASVASKQPGPETETLQTSLTGLGYGSTLYVRVCRATDDTDEEEFSITFSYECDTSAYSTDNTFTCKPCPANSTRIVTLSNSMADCTCDMNTYHLQNDAKNPNVFKCIPCPFGATCAGGTDEPKPMDGYYPLNNGGTLVYVKCPFPNACSHSSKNNTQLQVPIDVNVDWPIWLPYPADLLNLTKTNLNVTTHALCAQGYGGYLCGQCDSGYYRLGVRCLQCDSASTNSFLVIVYVGILLLVFFLGVPFAILNTHVSSFGILLNFIQISALFSLFNLQWDQSLLTFFDLLSIFNLNPQVFRPECVSPIGYFGKFMIIFWIPAMYAAFSIFPIMGWFICCKFFRQTIFTKDRFFKMVQWTIASYLGVTILQGYIALSSWTLSFYTCDTYGDMLTALPADSIDRNPRHLWHSSQICSTASGSFSGMLIFFYIGLGVYVLGIPLVTLVIWYWFVSVSRWRARKALASKEKTEEKDAKELFDQMGISPTSPNTISDVPQSPEEEQNRVNQLANELKKGVSSFVEGTVTRKIVLGFEARESVTRIFGVLYNRYRPTRYWWEIFVFLRKIGVVLCYSFLEQQPVVAVVLSSFVILASLVMNLYFQPYRKFTSNILESFLLLMQYCMLVLGLMFYASQYMDGLPLVGYSDSITSVIVIFVTLGIIVGVIIVIIEMIYEFRRTLYVPLRERMKELAMKNRAKKVMLKLREQRGVDGELEDEEHELELDPNVPTQSPQTPSRKRVELPQAPQQEQIEINDHDSEDGPVYDVPLDKPEEKPVQTHYEEEQPQLTSPPRQFASYDEELHHEELPSPIRQNDSYDEPSITSPARHFVDFDEYGDPIYEDAPAPAQESSPAPSRRFADFDEYGDPIYDNQPPQTAEFDEYGDPIHPSGELKYMDDEDDEEDYNLSVDDIPKPREQKTPSKRAKRDIVIEMEVSNLTDKKRQVNIMDQSTGEIYAKTVFTVDDYSIPIVVMSGTSDDVLFSVRKKSFALRPTYLVEQYGTLIGTCTQRFKVASRKFNLLCASGEWIKLVGEFHHHWVVKRGDVMIGSVWDNKKSLVVKLNNADDDDLLHVTATSIIMLEQRDSVSGTAFKL